MASTATSAVVLALLLLSVAPRSTAEDGCFIDAIYSFGDSIADTGNILRQGLGGAFITFGHFPYGETIHKPTGRCSDGLLMIDYLALALDLPLLNPYLDKNATFDHGVNFAVAGATALDASFFAERGIKLPYMTNASLSVQFNWFKAHISSICSSQADCAKKLERALFIVGEIGGNDYNYALFEGRPVEEVMNLVPLVVQRTIDTAKQLIDAGAVRLVVPGNFPIGCFPSYLWTFNSSDPAAYDQNKCLKSLNSFAVYHNEQLQAALDTLRAANPHVNIIYADYYHAFLHLLKMAPFYGFKKDTLLTACCGASGGEHNFDFSKLCGEPGTSTCENPADHVSWDGIHLTQEAYKTMAEALMMIPGFTCPTHGTQLPGQCMV